MSLETWVVAQVLGRKASLELEVLHPALRVWIFFFPSVFSPTL